MELIDQWYALPQAKKMQLAKKYEIKWYGTTDEQLAKDLENKLPKDLFPKVELKEVEPAIEPVETVEFDEPIKVTKKKKKSKKK